MTFAEEFKLLRKKAGLSQAKLAELAGVTQGWVSAIELGKKDIGSLETAFRLSDALGVPVEHWRPWILPPAPAPEPKQPAKKRAKK